MSGWGGVALVDNPIANRVENSMFGKSTKSFFAAFVTATIMAFSTSAHAVVIDFANYADVNGEASVGEGAPSYANPLPTDANVPVAGLLLSATGGVPYLDASSGGKRGGLGVCSATNGSAQCVPSSDDNVTSGETITISLIGGQSFDLQVTEFRSGGHNNISLSLDTLLVGINGGALSVTNFLYNIPQAFDCTTGRPCFWALCETMLPSDARNAPPTHKAAP